MTQSPIPPNRGPAPAIPLWVKLFVAIFLMIVLVVIAMHFKGIDFVHMHHMR